ncbi:hypothetical protein [Methylobacterium sp. DB0501]|uniref:hypothetical protein n=1 Tax=Methylobacterium sp. DB0501 TaxID=2709665 RepID=UPI0019D09145|nr:hypothetical protein [Methylobacterium sp. DB0501]
MLSETLRAHHPDWTLWLCISDLEPADYKLDMVDHGFDHVLWLKDLRIDNRESWIFRHNIVEICTAVKGFFLEKIFDSGADIVLYIDPDIAIFNSLLPLVQRLQNANMILTPHLINPEEKSKYMWENERSSLLHGVYNLGFLGVRNSTEGRRFAAWWRERLQFFCFEIASEGIYTDQRWCDLVPAFFEGVEIVRDPGYNVASWNISSRPITFDHDGTLYAGDSLLRFYHFTKITDVGEAMIDRYSGSSTAIFEIVKWYQSRLKKYEDPIFSKYWAYGSYNDGTPIKYEHRVLYRKRPDLQEDYPNPFRANSYLKWIRENNLN